MEIGGIPLGNGAPLVLIAGLNVLETQDATLEAASKLERIASKYDMPLVFKASFDKANRSSLRSFRGPGLDAGLKMLARVKSECGLPLLTDVHEPSQVPRAAEVVDCLQVPAFLCRQTDLLTACARTGLPVAIKKGQFIAPEDMRHPVEKVLSVSGNGGVFVTERGFAFGYHNLVVDVRGFPQMRSFAPVCFDATHSAQHPGAAGEATGGDRRFVAPLARAAVAVGIDALFVEVHEDPAHAPCDGPCQIDYEAFQALLASIVAIDAAARAGDAKG